MPNINLSDARARDAVVKAESIKLYEDIRYRGPRGQNARTRKVLKSTVDHDYDTLIATFGTNEALAKALVDGDPEVDLEREGMFLWGVSRVFINPGDELVYRIRQEEVVRGPKGKIRERREPRELEANVDSDIPLTWTGKMIAKTEAIKKFVFRNKLQIVHINGLTYDFLFEMAKELHEAQSLMVLGAGAKGNRPLIFRRRSTPYRAFLEGRIKGDKYILLLHLSNMEMNVPDLD